MELTILRTSVEHVWLLDRHHLRLDSLHLTSRFSLLICLGLITFVSTGSVPACAFNLTTFTFLSNRGLFFSGLSTNAKLEWMSPDGKSHFPEHFTQFALLLASSFSPRRGNVVAVYIWIWMYLSHTDVYTKGNTKQCVSVRSAQETGFEVHQLSSPRPFVKIANLWCDIVIFSEFCRSNHLKM